MEVSVYNQQGEKKGGVAVPDAIFGLKWNADLVYQVATSQEANERRRIAKVKDRAEVRGGGRKPWRQKGTGRARHGSIRSPLWKGGGVTHGPTKDRSFKKKINKKMAAKALATVLSAKLRYKEILFLDRLYLDNAKTKSADTILKNISKIQEFSQWTKKSILVALDTHDATTMRAFRNLARVTVEEIRNVTALDALRFACIIIPEPALKVLENRIMSKPQKL